MLAQAVDHVSAIASGGDFERFALALGLLLFAIGTVFAEAFFPSFGVLSLVALGFLIASIVIAFSIGTAWGILLLTFAAVLVPVSVWLAIRLLRKTSLVLEPVRDEDAALAQADATALHVGARGVALTTLRPSGTASFAGKRYSVVTSGDLVEKDAQLEVTLVDGTRITVKPVKI
jgi:membrane-bound serine protease (ClpP class)